jgi:hypothetical protein
MRVFSKEKNAVESSTYLLIDIGSDVVSATLVAISAIAPFKKPEIYFFTKERIAVSENFDFKFFVMQMGKALKKVCTNVVHSGNSIPGDVHVFLHSPWCAHQNRNISFVKNTNFEFTQGFARELIKRELTRIGKENSGLVSGSANVFEYQTVGVNLNGYEVSNPFGKSAKEVSITLETAFSEEEILNNIKELLAHAFNERKIIFHSAVLSSYVAVMDTVSNVKDFLLLTVGGNISELTLVRNDKLLQSASFPCGENNILQKASAALNVPIHEVESWYKLASTGKADTNIVARLKHTHGDISNYFNELFRGALVGITETLHAPKNIFVLASSTIAPTILEFIQNDEFAQYTLAQEKFNVIIINESNVRAFMKVSAELAPDVRSYIDCLFINHIHTN